jgi:hypothetical protein
MSIRTSQHVIEALFLRSDPNARVMQDIVEVLIPLITFSPTTPTGAGVSQDIVEVLLLDSDARARVSQDVLEVIVYDTSQAGAGGSGGDPGGAGPQTTRAFGFAV